LRISRISGLGHGVSANPSLNLDTLFEKMLRGEKCRDVNDEIDVKSVSRAVVLGGAAKFDDHLPT